MFICEKCGKLYEDDEIPTHVEHHPYGDGTADEVVADYECCGQTLEEAVQCDRCGEWYPIMSDDIFGNAYTICSKCYDEMYTSEKIVRIAKKQNLKSTVKINELLAYIYAPDEIERILFAKLKQEFRFVPGLCKYEQEAILCYANEDVNNTVDELFDIEKEEEPKTFSDRLKKILNDNNMSQKDLANKMGVTEGSISRYCQGNRLPCYTKLWDMAKALDCEVSDLVGEVR